MTFFLIFHFISYTKYCKIFQIEEHRELGSQGQEKQTQACPCCLLPSPTTPSSLLVPPFLPMTYPRSPLSSGSILALHLATTNPGSGSTK